MVCAWAMKAKGLSRDDAMARLRTRHEDACPNEGFMAQLELWERMGCRIDRKSPAYRGFCMEQLSLDFTDGG